MNVIKSLQKTRFRSRRITMLKKQKNGSYSQKKQTPAPLPSWEGLFRLFGRARVFSSDPIERTKSGFYNCEGFTLSTREG